MSEGFGSVRLIARKDISTEKWEELVKQSNNTIFMSYWYLDAVMEDWSAFVLNDYEMAFPIKMANKAGFNYALQPLFLRSFSVIGTSIEKINPFLENIFKSIDFSQLNFTADLPLSIENSTIQTSVYQFLTFREDYSILSKNYSENTRRKLKDFKKSNANFSELSTVSLLIDLFKKEKGEQFAHLKADAYLRLEKLMNVALVNKFGFIKAIELEGELVAIGFFIRKDKQLLYLKGIVSGKGKKIGAMQALFDEVIQENCASCIGLDFGGSSDAGLASFNKKFGACDMNYLILKQNKMPWPLKKWVSKKLGL